LSAKLSVTFADLSPRKTANVMGTMGVALGMVVDHNGKKLGGKRCNPFSATKPARLGLAIQWLTDG
jgi:hypothetical protein